MWQWIKLLLADPNCIVRPKLLADLKFFVLGTEFWAEYFAGPLENTSVLIFYSNIPSPKMTHFNFAQNFKNASIFGASIFGEGLYMVKKVTLEICTAPPTWALIYFRVNKLSISIPNPQKSNSILKLNFPNFVYFLGFVAKINLW